MPRIEYSKKNIPMKIVIEFTDVEVLEVDDIKQTVTIKMHLGVHWNDPRLESIDKGSIENQKLISIDIRMLDHLWIPDIEIWNLKDIRHFRVTKMLAGVVENNKNLHN